MLIASYLPAIGQHDSCWTLLLLRKGHSLEMKDDMSTLSKSGFYFYRNCVYEIELRDGRHLSGRLIDIKPDTLLIANYLNEKVASKAKDLLDTIPIHYNSLRQLKIISDRSMGLYSKQSFSDYEFIFRKDTTHCVLHSQWYRIFSNDTSRYELVPHLTAQGVSLLYEESGRPYYFFGSGMLKPDRSQFDYTYDVKNVFWFTPCKVEEINGIAFGLHPKNIKNSQFNERDSLIIRGVSIEVNPWEIISIMNPYITGPYPDSIALYYSDIKRNWYVKVHGVNLTLVNTINEMEIRGMNITGIFTVVDEIHGLSLSGLTNFSYILTGCSIAVLSNRAMKVKGIQIGLFNKATDLRGIQIGLWNTNGRRSLPLFNWQFKGRKS